VRPRFGGAGGPTPIPGKAMLETGRLFSLLSACGAAIYTASVSATTRTGSPRRAHSPSVVRSRALSDGLTNLERRHTIYVHRGVASFVDDTPKGWRPRHRDGCSVPICLTRRLRGPRPATIPFDDPQVYATPTPVLQIPAPSLSHYHRRGTIWVRVARASSRCSASIASCRIRRAPSAAVRGRRIALLREAMRSICGVELLIRRHSEVARRDGPICGAGGRRRLEAERCSFASAVRATWRGST